MALTAVYASPQETLRRDLWEKLFDLAQNMGRPWMLVGDFNDIAYEYEKKGGAWVDTNACRRFQNWVNKYNLVDLEYVGSKFTWKGAQREGMERVFKRLDRALANIDWRRDFGDARVEVLPRVNSDHHPILVRLKPERLDLGDKPFRFEIIWRTHHSFKDFLNSAWKWDFPLSMAIKDIIEKLQKWNKDVFGNLFRRKRRILNRIAGIQNAHSYGCNPFLDDLEKELSRELATILDQEKLLLLQNSRQQWIVDGDINTHFYHTKTTMRRRKNRIVKLRKGDGTWNEDAEEVKSAATEFFHNLYKKECPDHASLETDLTYPPTEEHHRLALSHPPTSIKIYKALNSIGSLKAPGEDGFPAYFFKDNWDLIKVSFTSCIRFLWNQPSDIKSINQTLISLIPKVQCPEFITKQVLYLDVSSMAMSSLLKRLTII
ncbi:uncharacterized protein [Arachis hypogaea]|uniref:uncharacterized protein n=1 Tax=Arachis hypogaea TaxID=3818 RepID=UPI001105711F|nr:uncharacterized protein LOC114925356 [Arachis hypogaea]